MESPPPAHRHIPWRPIVLAVVVVALLVTAKVLGLGERLAELREFIAGLGPLGPFAYIAIYVLAVVLAIPGSAVTLLAGILFGSFIGTVVVSVASVTGATLAFLIARYFARDSIAQWLARNEKFQRLDALTERHGAIMVAITRLVPLFPFNLLNYGFGLTRVRLWTYVFWSWLCMLPGTVLYVAGGDTVGRALAEGTVPWPLVGLVVGLLILTFALGWIMRRYLKKKEAQSDGSAGAHSAR
jgi:uncharacterized membrane protein YdjX (TVP38/TMEM64 family)